MRGPPATVTNSGTGAKIVPAAGDKEVLEKAAETAAKKSEARGDTAKVEKVVAATEKEAAATEQIKSMAEATPAAGTATTPAAVADTSNKAEKMAAKADEASAAKADVKVQLVDYSTQLMSERTALVDRLKLVLDKWEAKGGDPKDYRMYIASIGGIKIDVSDRAATMARISAWLTADEGGLRWARNLATFIGYIIGSVIVAWIVRMILRRAIERVAGDFAPVARLVHFQRRADHRRDRRPARIVGARSEPRAVARGGSAPRVSSSPSRCRARSSNFASGLLILINKPFDVGDEVEVGGGIRGRVTRVSIFSTYIETDDGLLKIVPNDNIWKAVIVNQTTGVVKAPSAAEAKPAGATPAAG